MVMYKVPIEESQGFREKIQVVSWRGGKSRGERFEVFFEEEIHIRTNSNTLHYNCFNEACDDNREFCDI